MADVSYEGDLDEPVDQGASDEGDDPYANTGGYTNPDGSTGYSDISSEMPEGGDEGGDYPASVGAALAVGGILIEMTAGAVFESTALDKGLWVVSRVVEGADAVWGAE